MREGDMIEAPIGANKGNPIGKIESRTTELKATVTDILELSIAIESFLLGAHPIAASEKAERKSPNGWLELHFEDLRDVVVTLQYVLECLRSIKSMSK